MSPRQNIIINIPDPCQENWKAMKSTSDGRFCDSCQTEVRDFTRLSDRELYNFLSGHDGALCGKFCKAQLKRVILPPSEPVSGFRKFWVKVLVSLVAFLGFKTLIPESVSAQTNVPQEQKDASSENGQFDSTSDNNKERIISGKITDEEGEGIPGATIKVKGKNLGTVSNSGGIYKLMIPNSEVKLIISSVGYQEKLIHVENKDLINVELSAHVLGGIESIVVGGAIIVKQQRKKRKRKRKKKQLPGR